ncbi:MAG TPA: TIGR00266 family protein, partial [Candidatus Baltobacteraceae bacterium]|nr:TIGR00266 family protein [Candidatus Baltobacteraceae bacterium]
MKYEISGTLMQTVAIDLDARESVYSQTSMMAWMNAMMTMTTHTGGGIFAGLKRAMSGGSFFVTEFISAGNGQITFAPKFPGKVIARTLAPGESLICRKESFLCAEKSVTFDVAFQQGFGAGLFGGEGFILQKITGPGTVWLDLSGEVVEKELQAGEQLLVHAGHVGVQTASVNFSVRMMPGFKNIIFGGDGLFLAELTGPGKVWLQSMPIMNLPRRSAATCPE